MVMNRATHRAVRPLLSANQRCLVARQGQYTGMNRRIVQQQPQIRFYTGQRPKNAVETAYHLIFKRNATYLFTIVFAAMILEATYGWAGDALWNALNYGVSGDDIASSYIEEVA